MNAYAMFDLDVDVVEEMRLRTWARANYVPADERDLKWHPVILEEMETKEREQQHQPRPK